MSAKFPRGGGGAGPFLARSLKPQPPNSVVNRTLTLRAISGNSYAHHFCVEKQEKLSGSRLSDHLRFRIQYSFQILLCKMEISTFS